MSKTTTITTDYSRELTVSDYGHEFNLGVKDTDGHYAVKGEVYTRLEPEEATKLANALLGENATVVTDLPKVTVDRHGNHHADGYLRSSKQNLDDLLVNAKALLAIHGFLVQAQAEKAEAEAKAAEEAKAKETARAQRRDELASEFRGFGTYDSSSHIFKAAIDRIIDLEEAAQVS